MTKRFINIDLIKVFAMLGVVFLHTCSGFAKRADFFDSTFWWLVGPLSVLGGFAVPLFFMVSGYLAGTKKINLQDNTKKTLLHLGLPLTFFFLIRLIVVYFRYHQWISLPILFVDESLAIMGDFLWYLCFLIPLRLLTPVFNLIFAPENRNVLPKYILWLVAIFMLLNSFGDVDNAAHGTLYGLLNATYFYLLGCMIKHQLMPNFATKKLIIFIAVSVILSTVALWCQLKFAIPNQVLPIASAWLSYLVIPSIFLLLLKIKTLPNIFSKIIPWLASMSFGVYLWQESVVIFRMDVLGFEYDFVGLNAYLYCSINFCLVLFASLLLTFLTSKIPKLKMVVGL